MREEGYDPPIEYQKLDATAKAPERNLSYRDKTKPGVRRLVNRALTVALGFVAATGALDCERAASLNDKGKDRSDEAAPPLNEEQGKRLLAISAEMEGRFGPGFIRYLREKHQENRQSQPDNKPTFDGFESLGLEPELLKKLWADGATYPRGWINGEISHLRIVRDEDTSGPQSLNPEKGYSGGLASDDEKGYEIIRFSGYEHFDNKKTLIDGLDWYFGHESSHANDWRNDRTASFLERVELMNSVYERMGSPDHFRHPLIDLSEFDRIENPQEREYVRGLEYWAQIGEWYFAFPADFQKNNPADYRLVDNWVKRTDPDFDPVAALAQRKAIIDEYLQSHRAEQPVDTTE